MIKYSLDTNIISYLLKGNLTIAERIRKEINDGNKIVFNPISYYEVYRGLKYIESQKKLDEFKSLCESFGMLEIKIDTFELAAKYYVELKKAGKIIEDADLLIASNCIINDVVLITNNVKHFERINELKFENWILDLKE